MTSHWKPHGKSHNDITVYVLDEQIADEHIRLNKRAWMLVHYIDETTLEFAVFEFFMSNVDGSDALHSMLLNGSGPSGELRECRHIWWGEDGYTHGLDFSVVEAALRELRRWYDGS